MYYITTPIIFALAESDLHFTSLTLMMNFKGENMANKIRDIFRKMKEYIENKRNGLQIVIDRDPMNFI